MIKFHYTYLIMAVGYLLCGYFINLYVLTSLILVHELGHYSIAKLLKFNVKKIIIYPYGGITKLDDLINKNINKELLVSISGIIMELIYVYIIYILYKHGYIREYTMNLFINYNKIIIYFNLLPIYPLDGSKIFNLLINKLFYYDLSNKITIIISILFLIIIIIKDIEKYNYSNIMSITVLITYIYTYLKKLKYYKNKFLLERYLYNYKYKKTSLIKDNKLYRDRMHIIKHKNNYYKEKDYLKNYFR